MPSNRGARAEKAKPDAQTAVPLPEPQHALVSEIRRVLSSPENSTVGEFARVVQKVLEEFSFGLPARQGPASGAYGAPDAVLWLGRDDGHPFSSEELQAVGARLRAISGHSG